MKSIALLLIPVWVVSLWACTILLAERAAGREKNGVPPAYWPVFLIGFLGGGVGLVGLGALFASLR